MRMSEAIEKLADALKKASEEHTRPNTFGCTELIEYGGPPPTLAGRIGSEFRYREKVWELLGHREGWGSCPAYSGGRWAV